MHPKIYLGFIVISLMSPIALAQNNDQEFRKNVEKRLRALETSTHEAVAKKEADQAWHDIIKFWGDFRFRYEEIKAEGSAKNRRGRLRVRLNASAKVNEEVSFAMQLVTGSTDPTSTNQTLDGGFSTKAISLDRAFVTWKPEAVEGLAVKAGKFPIPVYKPAKQDLHFDNDLNMEGVGAKFTCPDTNLFLNGGFFIGEQNSSTADVTLAAVQIGGTLDLGNPKITAGAGYFAWNGIRNSPGLFDTTKSFGNTMTNTGTVAAPAFIYNKEYEPFEAFGELHGLSLAGQPVKLFYVYIKNTATNKLDEAFMAGAEIGKTSKPGSWKLRYNYRSNQADSVVGVYTDSDSGGGGTDKRGHKMQGVLQLAENVRFGATYFRNETGVSGSDTDYNRLQLDLMFVF